VKGVEARAPEVKGVAAVAPAAAPAAAVLPPTGAGADVELLGLAGLLLVGAGGFTMSLRRRQVRD
jgi:LPXTG-motif cell wall-anchored protein